MENDFERKVLDILTGVQLDIGGLKSDVAGMKSDIGGLKSEVLEMKSDIEGLKSEVSGMKSDIEELHDDVKVLQGDMKEVKLELNELSHREEHHYNLLQQSIGDAFESVKILDRKKLDKEALKKII